MVRVPSGLVVILLGVALAVPVSADTGTPVTIETRIHFESFPFSGTFIVPTGAAALGCEGGTFVDLPRNDALAPIEKHMSCTAGPFAGERLVIAFKHSCSFFSRVRFQCKPGPGVVNGHWMIASATGPLAGLHGEGDMWIVFTGETTGEETLRGRIH